MICGLREFVRLLILCSGAGAFVQESDGTKTPGIATHLGPTEKDASPNDVVFVVVSQPHPHHIQRAELFKQQLDNQLTANDKENRPTVLQTHKHWPNILGAWTIFPLIPEFLRLLPDKRWIVVCDEELRMDLQQLLSVLRNYDYTQELFLGRAVRDKTATNVHYFAYSDDPQQFAYPDFTTGVVFSLPLIKRLDEMLRRGNHPNEFAIDAPHELAKYILDKLGVALTHVCHFCRGSGGQALNQTCRCVIWNSFKFPDCGPPVDTNDLFVAVKTCRRYHEDRVPVVKATWGQETDLIEYYSDVKNESIPTIDLGVRNTLKGHCGKTRAILQRAAVNENISSRPWLLIADDDTIISLELLRYLLACYQTEYPLLLGERYGYRLSVSTGYEFIPGGGGMVFNRAAINKLAAEFVCITDDSADDMMLGMYFRQRGLPLTHTPYFHQARPEDYNDELLSNQVSVSFHKHWNTDPIAVYHRLRAVQGPDPETARTEL